MQIMPINNYNNHNKYSNKVSFKHLLADSTFKQSPLRDKVLKNRKIQKFVKSFIEDDFDVYASAFKNKDNKQVVRLMLFRNGILSGHHIDLEEDMIDKFRMAYPHPEMLYSPNEIRQVPRLTEDPAADEKIKIFNYKLN